jgi:hypothetical protein
MSLFWRSRCGMRHRDARLSAAAMRLTVSHSMRARHSHHTRMRTHAYACFVDSFTVNYVRLVPETFDLFEPCRGPSISGVGRDLGQDCRVTFLRW